MGIREHLAKKEEDLKLADLNVEGEKGEEYFDWERLQEEITSEDKKRILDYVEGCYEQDLMDFLSVGSYLMILFPEEMVTQMIIIIFKLF